MNEITYRVYVKLDSNNVVVEILSNIESQITGISIDGWTQIDEGTGDKYTHAQGNYLDKGLIDINNKYNYKLVDGNVVELTEDEKTKIIGNAISV